MPIEPGTVLSKRYKVLSPIQQGGMGATYRGEDLETTQIIAIKELSDLFQTPHERETGINNFLAEMNVLKSLHHPQIPRIMDHFVEHNRFFFILEFVEGKDFAALLKEINRAGFPEPEVIRVGVEVCRVLDYLHSRAPVPIVHRDIKPANIMERTADKRIMILDFGIAKASKPKDGLMIGTVGYSAPEQHLNRPEPRSDLYSLGATLHELATGIRPSEESFEFAPPMEIRPGISAALSQIIMTALQQDPKKRFQNAKQFELVLQNLLENPIPPLRLDPFEQATEECWKKTLYPLFLKIQKENRSTVQCDYIPEHPAPFTLTLQAQIPYALLIRPNPKEKSLDFFLKEGLLAPALIGKIFPLEKNSWHEASTILEKLIRASQS